MLLAFPSTSSVPCPVSATCCVSVKHTYLNITSGSRDQIILILSLVQINNIPLSTQHVSLISDRRQWKGRSQGGSFPDTDSMVRRPTHRESLLPDCGTNRRPLSNRREGDIAFLLPAGQYSPSDRLALLKGHGKGHLDEKATGHPIIILRRLSEKSDHVLATTVSAYSSGPGNNFLAPWKQTYHRSKNPLDFFSFEGSERVNNKIPALHLEGGSWAKPKTSWVYSQSIFVVPVSVLCRYNKACGKQLRVRPDSLDFLRRHMEQRWYGPCSIPSR